jgi:hypothetical protein
VEENKKRRPLLLKEQVEFLPQEVWYGVDLIFTGSSTGKLAFLNNVIGLFEAGIGVDGNSAKTVWEWK